MTRLSSIKDDKYVSNEVSSTDISISENDIPNRKQSIFYIEKFIERYNLNQDFNNSPMDGTWRYIKKYYKPTPEFFKRQLFKRIPFIDWIRKYNLKEWLVPDIVSGLTIGIVHIPQGKHFAF